MSGTSWEISGGEGILVEETVSGYRICQTGGENPGSDYRGPFRVKASRSGSSVTFQVVHGGDGTSTVCGTTDLGSVPVTTLGPVTALERGLYLYLSVRYSGSYVHSLHVTETLSDVYAPPSGEARKLIACYVASRLIQCQFGPVIWRESVVVPGTGVS